MKILSLTAPWGTLMAIPNPATIEAGRRRGIKCVETRNWRTSYRGELVIHQSKGLGPVGGKHGFGEQCAEEPFNMVLTAYLDSFDGRPRDVGDSIPLGGVTCVVDPIGCYSTNFHQWQLPDGSVMNLPSPQDAKTDRYNLEYYFGDYSPQRWGVGD